MTTQATRLVPDQSATVGDLQAKRLLIGLSILLVTASSFWMLQGIGDGNRSFILSLRFTKLGALVTVGAAVGVSTVLFQTVATNRVLTPSIMGFDALYLLLQTTLITTLGVAGFAGIPVGAKFLVEVVSLSALAALLFGTLLGRGRQDILRTILTGIILGGMFRSVNALLTRLIDPSEFAVVQSLSFASFSRANVTLLPWGVGLTATAIAAALLMAPRLDVMGLGRDTAVALGLRFGKEVITTLALVAVLVSVSTALVGPVAFFGLLVTGLAHSLACTYRHVLLLPVAALISVNILVVGQLVFERVLNLQSTLSVVVEFAGGLFFIYLLLRGRIR